MQETGSQRAAKVSRSYHKLADRYISRKRWLSLFFGIVGLGYGIWLLVSDVGVQHVTTGDLSQSHFAWNNSDCEKCHMPFVPIRKDAWRGDLVANIQENNKQCNSTCHQVAGHFEPKTIKAVLEKESCSECHREHLGFDRSLIDVPDKDCSRCHTNLSAVAPKTVAGKVADNFSTVGRHPDFLSLAQPDPGTVRFSHAQHMRPGQPKSPNGADAKKLEMLPERYRDQYQNRVDENSFIQLKCSDCHSRDVELKGYENVESADGGSNSVVQSSSHKLFKPVDFAKHCAACHDLDGIPHGLNRNQLKQAIAELSPLKTLEYLKTQFKSSELEALAEGKTSNEITKEIASRKIRLEAMLEDGGTTCKKCHQPSNDSNSMSVVAETGIKSKWFTKAWFSHGAHLMMSCKECHDKAFATSDKTFDWEQKGNSNSQIDASEVMIPNITKCRECHIQDAQRRSVAFAKIKHVATADCVDCHRYHTDIPSKPLSTKSSTLPSESHRFLMSEKSP